MKRFSTAAVAAATALSLVATPAFAQTAGGNQDTQTGSAKQDANGKKEDSSKVTNEDAIKYAKDNKDKANGLVKPALEKEKTEDQEKALAPLASSLKSDKANGWEPGKTAAILLGTLLPAGILGLLALAAQSGALAGLGIQLPALPF